MAKTIKGIKVGSTTITASYTDGGVTKTSSVAFTVSKAAGSVTTAPTNKNAVYGSGGALINAGSGTGTMMYRVGTTGSFSSTIPTTSGLNAGTYTLYYYAAESTSYNQSSTESISVTVVQKEVGLSWGTTSWIYDGSAHSTTCAATGLVGSDTCTVTLSSNSVGPEKNTTGVTVTASSLSNGNYKLPSTKTTTIKINARPVRYVATDQSKAYDGSKLNANNSASLTVGTYSGTTYYELVSGHTATITGSGSTSAATAGSTGTKTISVVIKSGSTDVSSNYAITTVNGTLSITKASGSVSTAPTNSNVVYGSGNNLCSAGSGTGTMQYKLDSGSWSSTIPTATTSVAAGNHTLYYRAAASDNYNQSSEGSITVSIQKKGVTVTWGTTSWTYDGSTHSTTCEISSGVISGTTCTVSLSGNSVAAAAGSTATVTATLSNDNYTISSGSSSKTLSISKRPVTYTATNQSKAYDGSKLNANNEATLTAGSLVGGHSATITGSGSTSAATAGSTGTKTISVVIKSGSTDVSSNYAITTVNGTLSITKASGSVSTAPTNAAVTYGSGNNLCSAGSGTGTMQYKLDSGSWSSTIPTATTSVNAGNHTLYYRAAASDNYNQSSEGSITVTVAKKGVTVSWGTTSWTYDGSTHSTTCEISSGVISGTTCTVSLSGNSVAAAAGSTATVTASLSNDNYTISSGSSSKTLSISKRPVTYTATNQSKAYDGSKLNANNEATLTAGSLVSGHSATITGSGSTSAATAGSTGTKTISVVIKSGSTDVSSNYAITTVNGTLTITAASITIPTPTGYTGTYDANSHSASFPAATGANITKYRYDANGGSSWTESTTLPTRTNVGTTTVQAYYSVDGNHTGSDWSSTASIKINQKAITITAGSASKAFDGTALTKSNGTTASGLITSAGHSLTSYTNTGSQTYFGSSNNVPSNAVIKDSNNNNVTSNYSITYAPGTLTVTKADPQISIQGITADYTGGEFYAKVIGTKAKGTLYWKKGSVASTSDTAVTINSTGTPLSTPINITYVKNNVDDFVLYWYFVPSSAANSLASGHTYAENYNTSGGTSNDKVNLIIEPRSIANVSASATAVTYNGSQQTASVTITDSGATLTSNDYTISGNTGTNATNYTITITGRNNYTGTKTITWTINKRAVTITAGSDSKTYDGTALTKNTVSASAQSENTGMISSHHVHSWTVSGTQTLAGSSANTVTAATIYDGTHSGTESNVTSNYTITYANGTLTVNTRAVTATATNQTKVYDGSKLTATNTGTVTNLPSNHTITYSCGGEIGPGVSSGTKTLSSVVIKNSGGTDVTSSFAVTKKNGTLEITNATITYVTYTTTLTKDCTTSPVATNSTNENIPVEIASASATDYSGTAITSGSTPATEGYTTSTGWAISSDGKTITVPSGVAAGTYNVTITVAKPNHTSKENVVAIKLNPVTLTGINMELNAYEVAYGASTTVKTVTATYSNNKSKDVTASATYSATKDASNDDIVEITTT